MARRLGQVDLAALWRKRVDADDVAHPRGCRCSQPAADPFGGHDPQLDDVLAAMRLQSRHGAVIFVDYLQTSSAVRTAGARFRERIDAVLADSSSKRRAQASRSCLIAGP